MPLPRFLTSSKSGFTLIELLVVISIIGILAAIVFVAINPSKRYHEFYFSKSKEQLALLVRATEAYALTNGDYPPDADRNVPTGLLTDLRGSSWPNAPWPGSVFDWDNIDLPSGESYQQYSIRFCSIDGENCQYPRYYDWADGFDAKSSVYYCMSGPCRSHRDNPQSHPGYCINCREGEAGLD